MKKTYTVITAKGKEIRVSKTKFYEILNRGTHNLYSVGGCSVLLPKKNQHLVMVHRLHRNDIAREWARVDRMTRCRDEKGHICKQSCKQCDKQQRSGIIMMALEEERDGEVCTIEIEDEAAEREILLNTERKELSTRLYATIATLQDIEREVITLLYLNDFTISISACAALLNKNRLTIKRVRDRALAKLGTALADFKDYV